MRLASISGTNGTSCAVVVGDEVVDLAVAAPELPRDMADLLALGAPALALASAAADGGRGRGALSEALLLAPVPRPGSFFAVGLNYADHVAESGIPVPEFPTIFAKMSSSVSGPTDDVHLPHVSDKLDYEGELGFVIGRRCRNVPRDRAHEVIAGYVVVNDFSVRDYQLRTAQWTLGKSFDTHGVFGPWIVTPDELDPHALDIRTLVNGELRQSSNTRELIFDCFEQIAVLSSACTLSPGDVVATGTPGGVGIATDTFLQVGDVVTVEIEGIGALVNHIVAEPASQHELPGLDAVARMPG